MSFSRAELVSAAASAQTDFASSWSLNREQMSAGTARAKAIHSTMRTAGQFDLGAEIVKCHSLVKPFETLATSLTPAIAA